MDVVRANIERIGGIVDVDSKPRQGLRLTLRVPLTLTIIPALTVSVGGQSYAIPRSAIEEIVRSRGGSARVETLGGSRIATIRDKRIPLVALCDVLEVPSADEDEQHMIVLKPAGGDLYALAVDAVHDHEELVVKPAAPAVMATGLYAGTTLADDGSPILLLDPSGIAACAGLILDQNDKLAAAPAVAEEAREEVPALLFRTLEGARRAVRLALVERIEDVPVAAIQYSGGRMRVALNGRILPLAGCAAVPEQEKLRIFRLSDGEIELAYGFGEVIDIVSLDGDVEPATGAGEVGGVTLVNGEQVELLDPYWLFEMFADGAGPAERPVCVLPVGDSWMDHILRPMVESAGYRVVREGEAEAASADIVIVSAEGSAPNGAGKVLKIRMRPEAAEAADDSIYRYDRAALMSALSLGAAERRKA
jgi:two-component system chemotaxis sensor kinase CheA